MAKRPMIPGQFGLFRPESNWLRPRELPDLRGREIVALDTETRDDGLAANRGSGWCLGPAGYIAGVSWATDGSSGYAPMRHPDTENFDPDRVHDWLRDLLRSGTRFVFHNGPYDLGWMGSEGLPTPENIEDTAAAAVMLDENQRSYSLDECCLREGLPGKDETLLREAARSYGADPKAELWRLPAKYVGPYAEQDAVATLNLFRRYEPQLRAQEVWSAYRTEMELVPMVVAMRRRGIRIDTDHAEATARQFRKISEEALAEIARQLPGNRRVTLEDVRSPQWLQRTFSAEGISYPKAASSRADRERGSFQKEWMERHPHWLPKLITKVHTYETAASKFIENFILGYSHRGRIHAEVHQFKTDAGGTRSQRFSYSDPALQQMSSPDKDPQETIEVEGKKVKQYIEHMRIGKPVRQCFLPEEDCGWLGSDYCHDDKTEVLTDRGFVLFSDLSDDDKVAQWWPGGTVDFVVPSDRYVGEARPRNMVRARGPRQVDFCVTDNHRMIIDGESVLAGDLEYIAARSLPQLGVSAGNTTESEHLVRLVVALQADAADRGGTWRFYLSKVRKLRRLCWLLDSLKIAYTYKTAACGNKDGVVIKDDPRIRALLSSGKTFNLGAILALTPDLRRAFLSELGYWDRRCGAGNNPRIDYGSTNKANVGSVSAIAACTGVSCVQHAPARWGDNRKTFYTVSLYPAGRARDEVVKTTRVEYCGRVYCVTVPSHVIITRREGRVLVSGQSQQEPRLTVHFAYAVGATGSDEAVRRYLENPRTDYHSMVAEMTGKPRPIAKILNLGMTYGKGKRSLAEELGVPLDEAEKILEDYHHRLPFIKSLETTAKNLAGNRGYIRLLDGARIHYNLWEGGYMTPEERAAATMAGKKLNPCEREEAVQRAADPDHPWSKTRLRRADTRKALNNLVQGSAARQTKLAMLQCWREGILPLIQMHDELGCSVSSKQQVERVSEIMRDAVKLHVPVIVDAEVGPNWGEAKLSWDDYAAKYRRAT